MIPRNLFRGFLTGSALLVTLSSPTTAETVYDSIGDGATGEGVLFSGHHLFASLIQLAGKKRRVETIEVNLHARDRSVTPKITGAIHLDDGGGHEPGSLLWESTMRQFPLGIDPSQRVSIDVPFVSVPDRLWVVVGIDDDPSDGSPLRFRALQRRPLVGENERNRIKSINSDDFESLTSTLAMTVMAVPEPSTLALLLVGLAALIPGLRCSFTGRRYP